MALFAERGGIRDAVGIQNGAAAITLAVAVTALSASPIGGHVSFAQRWIVMQCAVRAITGICFVFTGAPTDFAFVVGVLLAINVASSTAAVAFAVAVEQFRTRPTLRWLKIFLASSVVVELYDAVETAKVDFAAKAVVARG